MDAAGALARYERATLTGEEKAWSALARSAEEAGDRAASDDTAERAARAGHPQAWLAEPDEASVCRRRAAAPRGVREAVRAGEPWGLMGQARLDAKEGDCLAAESAYEAAAAAGVQAAFASLVELRWRAGDLAGAERAQRRRRQAQDTEAYGASWRGFAESRGTARGEAQALTGRPPTGRPTRSPTSPVPVRRAATGRVQSAPPVRRPGRRRRGVGGSHTAAEVAGETEAADAAARTAALVRATPAPARFSMRLRGKLRATAARAPERCRSRGCRRSGDAEAWAVTCPCVRERADDRGGSERALARGAEAGGVGALDSCWPRVREQRGDSRSGRARATASRHRPGRRVRLECPRSDL